MSSKFFQLIVGGAAACEHHGDGKYCPSCGKQLEVPSLNANIILGDFREKWMERGFRRTLFGLFWAPGQNLRKYIHLDRDWLVRPVLYLTIAAAFALWAMSKSGDLGDCAQGQNITCEAVKSFPVLLQLCHAGVLAVGFRFFFYRHGQYGFWDYAVIFAYLFAQSFIITGVFSLLQVVTGINGMINVAIVVKNIYLVFALIQVHEARTFGDIAKVILANLFLLAMFMFLIFVASFLYVILQRS